MEDKKNDKAVILLIIGIILIAGIIIFICVNGNKDDNVNNQNDNHNNIIENENSSESDINYGNNIDEKLPSIASNLDYNTNDINLIIKNLKEEGYNEVTDEHLIATYPFKSQVSAITDYDKEYLKVEEENVYFVNDEKKYKIEVENVKKVVTSSRDCTGSREIYILTTEGKVYSNKVNLSGVKLTIDGEEITFNDNLKKAATEFKLNDYEYNYKDIYLIETFPTSCSLTNFLIGIDDKSEEHNERIKEYEISYNYKEFSDYMDKTSFDMPNCALLIDGYISCKKTKDGYTKNFYNKIDGMKIIYKYSMSYQGSYIIDENNKMYVIDYTKGDIIELINLPGNIIKTYESKNKDLVFITYNDIRNEYKLVKVAKNSK